MARLLSRTSITIDEAVSILLGRSTGPIDFEPMDVAEDAEAIVHFIDDEAPAEETDDEAMDDDLDELDDL